MNTVLMCSLPTSQEATAIIAALKAAGIPPDHVSLTTNRIPAELPQFPGVVRSLAAGPLKDILVNGALGAGLGIYVSALCRFIPGLGSINAWDPLTIIECTTAVGALLGGLVSLQRRMSGHSQQPPSDGTPTDGYIVTLHPSDERESDIAHQVVTAAGHADVMQEA
jgi:hypothetical protein